MKKIVKKKKPKEESGRRPHYDFDYTKARPNRFSSRLIPIDDDVAKIFNTPELVNNALRSIISAFPKSVKRKAI